MALKSEASGRTRQLKAGESDGAIRRYIGELRALGGGRISCGAGLSIRVYAESAKFCLSWMPPRRPGEKREPQRTAVIGDTGSMTLAKARAAAEDLRAKIAGGYDPIASRRADRGDAEAVALQRRAQEERDARELQKILAGQRGDYAVLGTAKAAEAVEAFLLHAVGGGEENRKNIARDMRDFIAQAGVGGVHPSEITAAQIENFLAGCGPAKARHTHGALRRFFEWLRRHDAIVRNVCEKVEKPAKPRPRTGIYSAADIKALWEGSAQLPPAKRDFLRFMLLVPLRRQEAANLTIGSIHQENGRYEIRLTGDETKNDEPIRIPLVGAARDIVLAAIDGRKDGYVFRLAAGEMQAWSKFTTLIREKTGVQTFTWHDNRRTFSTTAGEHELGDFNIVDGLLNHKSAEAKSGVKAHYFQAALAAPRTRLLTRWDETIAHAVAHGEWPALDYGDSNVVSIRRGSN